jgi:hypothetical protein
LNESYYKFYETNYNKKSFKFDFKILISHHWFYKFVSRIKTSNLKRIPNIDSFFQPTSEHAQQKQNHGEH